MDAADAREYELSFPVDTVRWDGRRVSALPRDAIAERLDLLASLGVRWVMLAGYHVDEPSDFDPYRETEAIGALLAARRMRAAQHHAVAASYATDGAPETEVARALERCVDFTAGLRAGVLVLHAGKPFGRNQVPEMWRGFREETARSGLDGVIRRAAGNFSRAGEYAAHRGVRIALENIDGVEPLCSLETLPRLIREANAEAVGFCLDTGHAWCAGTPISAWMQALGDKLFTTHVHDNHGPPGPEPSVRPESEAAARGDEHLPPGFGTIPWRAVISELWRSGFVGPLNFESKPWPDLLPRDGYRHAIAYWRAAERYAAERWAENPGPDR